MFFSQHTYKFIVPNYSNMDSKCILFMFNTIHYLGAVLIIFLSIMGKKCCRNRFSPRPNRQILSHSLCSHKTRESAWRNNKNLYAAFLTQKKPYFPSHLTFSLSCSLFIMMPQRLLYKKETEIKCKIRKNNSLGLLCVSQSANRMSYNCVCSRRGNYENGWQSMPEDVKTDRSCRLPSFFLFPRHTVFSRCCWTEKLYFLHRN